MFNEKRVKATIIISLLLVEGFVWIINGPNNFWSLGFYDGTGGSISTEEPGNGEKQPGDQSGDMPDEDQGNEPGDNLNEQPGENVEDPDEDSGEQDVEIGYPPEDNRDREVAFKEAVQKGLLILVNKQHPIDQDYKPDDLKKIRYYASDRSESTRYMRAEAADAFHQMVDKAAQEGIELKMTTAYRSYDFQKILYDSYVAKEGEATANTYSAKPGQSEHQTGLSVDVTSPSVDNQLSNDYGKTKEGKWLADHAYRFGFIIRFPQGKEGITGYQYEPWHIRYVGLAAAKEIHEQNLTLEEFLEENNIR